MAEKIVLRSGIVYGLIIFSITIGFTTAFAQTDLEKITIIDPRLENGIGASIGNNVNVDQQVQVSATIFNNQQKSQDFIYIIQIKNETGVVVSLRWFSGQLSANQQFSPSISWLPHEEGEFTAEIYVWNDFKDKIDEVGFSALTDYSTIKINVS